MANGCILAVTISTGRTSARRAGLVNSKTAQHLFKGLLRETLLLLLLSIGLPLLQLFLHPAEEGFEFVFRPTKLLQKFRIDLTIPFTVTFGPGHHKTPSQPIFQFGLPKPKNTRIALARDRSESTLTTCCKTAAATDDFGKHLRPHRNLRDESKRTPGLYPLPGTPSQLPIRKANETRHLKGWSP